MLAYTDTGTGVGSGVTGVLVGVGGISTPMLTVANSLLPTFVSSRRVCVPGAQPMNTKLVLPVNEGVVSVPVGATLDASSPQSGHPMAGEGYSIFRDKLLGVTSLTLTVVELSKLMEDGEALKLPLGTGVGMAVGGSVPGVSVGVDGVIGVGVSAGVGVGVQ